jgi:hypothetical protein
MHWFGSFRTPILIALVAGLKIFPALALPFVFKLKNHFAYLLALAIASPLLIATLIDVLAILAATPVCVRLSNGILSFAAWLGVLAQKFAGFQSTSRLLILLSAAVLLCIVWGILVISRAAGAYVVQRRDICRGRIALPAGRYLRNGYAQTRLTKTMSMDWELVKVGKAINELMEV